MACSWHCGWRTETRGPSSRRPWDRGLLINAPRPDSLRFMPALNVSRDEIDEMLRLLEVSLSAAP